MFFLIFYLIFSLIFSFFLGYFIEKEDATVGGLISGSSFAVSICLYVLFFV